LLGISNFNVVPVRIRVGLAFAVASFGVLIGYPVDGRLLGKNFSWIKPITFSGVGLLSFLHIEELYTHASIDTSLDSNNWIDYCPPNACSQKKYADHLRILYACVCICTQGRFSIITLCIIK